MSKFNEDTRVKIPAILHLARLGYDSLSLKDATWDESSNIFPEIFKDSINSRLAPPRANERPGDNKIAFTPYDY
jgi:type I restriction enzyme R subunit